MKEKKKVKVKYRKGENSDKYNKTTSLNRFKDP